MFDSEFDPQSQPDDLDDYPEEWEEYLPESFDDGSPDYLPEDYPIAGYQNGGGYQTDDYSTDDFSIGPLPKFLFICTILACLILAAGLSLVTIQFPAPSSQAVVQSETGTSEQPLSDAAQPAGSPDANCVVSQRFPDSIRRWCGLITQYASKHGLPPDLVAALIWQESGGNPVAYSRSGAVGLMQVMPSDGLAASFQCVNGPCFSTRPSTDELKNPEFNVSYGTRMLAGLVGKTGDLREALKSYGPANVGYYYADKVLGIYQSYRN